MKQFNAVWSYQAVVLKGKIMEWKELGKKIAGVGAPLLGGAIGGPGGAAIGTIVSSLFDMDPEAGALEIMAKISADPEAIVKLKQVEIEHKHDLEKIYIADVQSARSREVEVTKATGQKDTNLYALAWVSVIGFFACVIIALVVSFPADEAAKAVLAMLFGTVVSSYKDIIGYFFGSSKGSSDKTALMKGK